MQNKSIYLKYGITKKNAYSKVTNVNRFHTIYPVIQQLAAPHQPEKQAKPKLRLLKGVSRLNTPMGVFTFPFALSFIIYSNSERL